MKIKLGVLFNSLLALNEIKSISLNVVKSYFVRKLLGDVQKEVETIEKTRLELIEKYGVKKEDGVCEIIPNTDEHKAFLKDMGCLFDSEIELKSLKEAKLTLDDIKGDETKPNFIKPETLSQLDWLID